MPKTKKRVSKKATLTQKDIARYIPRKAALVITAVVAIACVSLVPLVKVHGISVYDSVYKQGDPVIKCTDNSEVDVGTSYLSKIWPDGNFSSNDVGKAWLADVAYGSGTALVQNVNTVTGTKDVSLYVSSDPANTSADFNTDADYPSGYIRMLGYSYVVSIDCSDATHFSLSFNIVAYGRSLASTTNSFLPGYETRPIYINMPLLMPDGYAGAPIATTIPPKDTTPPTVSNLTLSGSHNITDHGHRIAVIQKNHVVTISANASDASGIASSEYFIDKDPGKGSGTPMTITNGLISAILPTKALSYGTHVLYVRAKDGAGNWSDPISVTFTIHTQSEGDGSKGSGSEGDGSKGDNSEGND